MFEHDFAKFITEQRLAQCAANVPCISAENAVFLCQLLAESKPNTVLEIGSCHGLSACHLAQAGAVWGAKVLGLELSELNFLHAMETVQASGLDNLTLMNVDALDYLQTIEHACLDFVFIDAQKSKTLDFYLAVIPKLTEKALVVVDDALKHAYKMQTFYQYLHTHKIAYTLYPVDADDACLVIRHSLH